MSQPVLTTKLRPPPARADRMVRGRLLDRLDRATAGRLTLISAPAGYGKTTLLATWAERTALPVAWLSLDEGDNAPQRLMRHLVASLQRRDETLRQLGDFVGDDLEAALITVVNDVAENLRPLVLALDDYHRIRSERVHELVRFLLDHGPPQLRLVIATRRDPPLPVARLRLERQLSELRGDALRFTSAEAAAALDRQGIALDAADLEELTLRTEGWPAGLHLAALSLQGRSDPHAFIGVFTGTDRFVLAYLTEEVLLKQPPAVQDFLLMSSILEEFDAELAAAVTGDATAGATLERIERNNLFLQPVDPDRQRFRYHAFFQDLLLHRLRSARPDLPATLHRRAAEALSARGEAEEALIHAALAHDDALLHRVLASHPRGERAERAALAVLGRASAAAPEEELRGALREALDSLAGLDEEAAPAAPPAGGALRQRQDRGGEARMETDAAAPEPEPLSERELEVLRLIAAGYANKQIARRLDLSPNTVKTHVRNVYGKLGVRSRTQAAARARDLGLA